jgi:hypothetical protein
VTGKNKGVISIKWMSGVSDHHMSRFVVAEEEKPKVYETERKLLHETLDKRKLSPSSSARQSEGFVNLRSRVRVPLRALIVVFSDNGNAGASIGVCQPSAMRLCPCCQLEKN